jgi:pimeloyl-ACP methyl ester carboxylesterase
VRLVKQALFSGATLNGALDYYRALALGGSRLLDKPPPVAGLIVGGTADVADAELYRATPALLPAPSRALIVEGAGHWPHRENAPLVSREILSFVGAL